MRFPRSLCEKLNEIEVREKEILRLEAIILEEQIRTRRLLERLLPHPNHIVISQGEFMPTQSPLIGGTPGSTVNLTLFAVDTNGNAGAFPAPPAIVSDNANVVPTVGNVNPDGSYPVSVAIADSATVGETCNLTASAGSITSGAVPFPTDAPPFVAASIVITQP